MLETARIRRRKIEAANRKMKSQKDKPYPYNHNYSFRLDERVEDENRIIEIIQAASEQGVGLREMVVWAFAQIDWGDGQTFVPRSIEQVSYRQLRVAVQQVTQLIEQLKETGAPAQTIAENIRLFGNQNEEHESGQQRGGKRKSQLSSKLTNNIANVVSEERTFGDDDDD